VRQVVFTDVLIVGRLDVDGQSFAPIGLHKTDAASDWLLTKWNCARIHRPSFCENKLKTLVFSHTKRAFWACLRENWVYNFGHCIGMKGLPGVQLQN
jgi:hypothetical protein